LTGQIKRFEDLAKDDYRRNSPRFQGENFQRQSCACEKSRRNRSREKMYPAQLCLAWVLAQGNDIVPDSRNQNVADICRKMWARLMSLYQ